MNIFIIVSFFALGFAFYVYVFTLKMKSIPYVKSLNYMMLALIFWLIGEIIYYSSSSFSITLFGDRLKYLGLAFVPPSVFLFAYKYYKGADVRGKYRALLGVIPVLTIIMAFTNDYHHYFWTCTNYINYYDLLLTRSEFGPWFKYVHMPYSYSLLVLTYFFIFRSVLKYKAERRMQSIFVTLSIMIPMLGNLLYMLSSETEQVIDFTSVLFVFSGLFLYISITKFGLLEVIPFAKEMVFEKMDDSILILDLENKIVEINDAFLNTFELSREASLGQKISFIWERLKINEAYSEWKESEHVTIDIVDSRGKLRSFILSDTEILSSKDKVIGWLILFHDVTVMQETLKSLEIEREKATEAAKAKSQFIANVSHEVRTPMNSIIGMTEIIMDTELTEKQGEYLNTIKSSSEILLELINSILDSSKIESGKMTLEQIPVDLEAVSKETMNIMIPQLSKKIIDIHCDFDKGIPKYILGDPLRIKQILFNLLSNAIKFTAEGRITIIFRKSYFDDKFVGIVIKVSDTGIGISKDRLEKLFESFYQTDATTTRKYGGTGLGLNITKQLIDMMGGSIEVESEEQAGTSFTINLKFEIFSEAAQKQVSETVISDEVIHGMDIKLLLAEDNKTNQKLMKMIFNKLKIRYDIANNGKEAVEKAKNNDYDIILMDIQMPILDGIEATKQIREFSEIIIVGLSANASIEDAQEADHAGMNAYLTKPINQDKLKQELVKIEQYR